MATPPPIGRVRYTEPRGVQVREPDDVKQMHSAVHGSVAVYTDSLTEAQVIIAGWSEIMQAVNQKVVELILRDKNTEG